MCFFVDPGWQEATVLPVILLASPSASDSREHKAEATVLEGKLLSFVPYPIGYKNRSYLVYKGWNTRRRDLLGATLYAGYHTL